MKKNLLTFLMLIATVPLWAHDFEKDGIYYNIIDADNKMVAVTYYGDDPYSQEKENKYSGFIIVPEDVIYNGETYSITEIGKCAFSSCSDLNGISTSNSVTIIGSYAFEYCTSLIYLEIGENITELGYNYLEGNEQNLEIIMRSTNPPAYVDPYEGHDKSQWVLRIPMEAYSQYEAQGWIGDLQVIGIDGSLPGEHVDNGIKYDVDIENKKAKVIGYENGLAGEVIIPNTIPVEGVDFKVVEIADKAFANCTGMTKIVIGENITTLGHVIFMGCTGLTEVEWNAINCTNYKFEAFLSLFRGSYHIYSEMLGCSFEFPEFDIRNQITSFKFGDKVEHIPALSCWGLSNVKSIEVPASVKSIGMYSFNEMSGLTSFSIQGNESYCFDEETGILYNADKTNAIVGFPAMISSDVVLPQSVTTVSRCAFLGCNNLKSITFNENIQSIEDHIFIGCDGLQEIVWNVPDYKRDQYHYDSQLGFLYSTVNAAYLGEDVAYDLRDQITSLKFGENITTIHDNIFRYMTNISSLSIPSNVTTIIGSAFTGWNNLANIEVGAVVPPTMEYYAFSNYENITVVVPPGCVDTYKANQNWGQFRNIVGPRYTDENGIVYELISDTEAKVVASTEPYSGHVKISSTIKDDKGNDIKITTIGEYAFCACDDLTGIDIPETITTIKSYAFEGCYQLKIEDIPASITTIEEYAFCGCSEMTSLTIHENITSIGSSAFHETSIVNVEWNAINLYNNGGSFLPSTVKNINFGNDVEYIPMYACQGLTNLTSIVIPDAVEKIDVYAFDNCTSLSEVKIGKSVTDIMYLAFGNCTALENIILPDATTNIDYAAFQGCSYLKNVTIGSGIKNIGEYAFDGCLRLEKVTAKATTPPTIAGANAFTSDTYKFAELYVKYGYKTVYEKELFWRNFETITEESSPNHFEIESSGMNASRGGKFSIPLNLVNDNEIAGFQADIYMPSGFSVATNGGEYEIELSGRASPSHSVSYNVMSDGALRIVAYSTDAKAFDGNEGVVVNINVKVAENFNGSSSVEVKNVVMTSPTNVEFKCSDVAFDVTIKDPAIGNANGEGDVNVTDVIATANFIVGDNTTPIDLTNADVNADGEVNVVDVVGISSIILGTNSATMQVASGDEFLNVKSIQPYSLTANNLFIEDFTIEPGQEKEMSVMLTNEVAFTAFQADLYLPAGLSIKGDAELTSRKANHTMLSSKRADGAMRVLSYSATNRDYNGEDGALLTFIVVADNTFQGGKLAIKNVIFSQRDMKVYKFNNTEAKIETSGIESVIEDSRISISIVNGEIVVNADEDAQIAVYSINGGLIYQGINRPVAVAAKGVYVVVVNGNAVKVVI